MKDIVGADQWFSRERAAGCDPEVLSKGRVLVGGAGALGNNLVLALALVGVGELLVVDFDSFEGHNLTRSPLYPSPAQARRWGMEKAKVVAHRAEELGRRSGSRARYRVGWVQELPGAVFRYVDVVANGADNLVARAYCAEKAFLAGRPFVDAGFYGPDLNVAVYVPGDPRQDPCWRCLHPGLTVGMASCRDYASRLTQRGIVPALQTAAQVAGGLQAEQVLRALHGDLPLRNRLLCLDVRTGHFSLREVSRDPACPSLWHRMGGLPRQEVPDSLTWGELLEQARTLWGASRLTVGVPLGARMPCVSCGELMESWATMWLVEAAPFCQGCGGPFPRVPDPSRELAAGPYPEVSQKAEELLPRRPDQCGLGPGDIVVAEGEEGPRGCLVVGGEVGEAVRRLFRACGAERGRSWR